MSLLSRLKDFRRQQQDIPGDDYGFVVDRANSPDLTPWGHFPSFESEIDYGANELYAKALMPYGKLSKSRQRELIDGKIMMMMRAAEDAMIFCGDVWQAFISQIELAGGDIIINHEDSAVEEAYRDWFDRSGISATLEDAWLDSLVCGQGFLVGIGEGEDFTFLTLNPRHVAVGAQVKIGSRPIVFFPGSRSASDLRNEFYHYSAGAPEWNEWKDVGDADGVPLNSARVIHMSVAKRASERYAIPPVIRAWDDVVGRLTLEEMRQATMEGVKSQIRLWTFDNPRRGEVAKLSSALAGNRGRRTFDLVWGSGLEVKQLLPGVIDELMAQELWLNYTSGIFRRLGMFMRLISGDVANSRRDDNRSVEIEILIALSRLKRGAQHRALATATQMAKMYSKYGDKSLEGRGLPDLRFVETTLSTAELVRGLYVPLLNYGLVSARTVHEGTGIDHAAETARLEKELPLRDAGIIRPYTSFAQSGPTGTVEHAQSPGRPPGADMDTENAEVNKENARRNGK